MINLRSKHPRWASALAGLFLAAQGFAADWTPAQLGSGTVKNWYDADAASTLWQDADGTTPVTDSGQAVLRWTDKSGNGNHLTSANGPAYAPGVMNSRPVLQFADSSFARTGNLTMGNITDNFTVVGVFNVTANNGWDNWIRWGNGGVGDPDVFVVSGGRAGGPAQGMEFAYDGGEGETTDTAVTGGAAFMFIGALDQVPSPVLFSVWKDGVSQGSRNPTPAYRTTPSASLSEFRIGIPDNSNRNPNGDLAELLILNTGTGNLAPADRERLEGYLAHKWWGAGDANPLPAEHPYKATPPQAPAIPLSISSQPEDVFLRLGQSATFSVTANGSEPLSYQWYFQGSSIDGAKSYSYSISPVADFDAGGYSVVVSDSFGGSVTSRVATLTILPFGGATLGVNFSTDCPPSASIDAIQLSEVADGFQGWENIPIRTCAGQNIVPGNATVDDGVVTVSWAASAVWYDGSTATPDEKLFRIYLDDGDAGNVTVSGLSAWLAQVTATNSALDAFKVRLYWSANTGSSLAPLDIHDGSDAGPVLETVQPLLPGYGTGVQRAMGDSAPLNSDTIAITWPARPADLSVRASLAAFKITASESLQKPEILSQPQSIALYEWSTTTLSVGAIGSLPLAYQWRHNGTEIGGATSPTLPLANLQATDAGDYRVVVSNPAGAVTSQVATVSFRVPAPGSYEAAVTALQPLAYWLLDETNGTTALDYVSGANGVYQNGPLLGQPGATTNTGTSVRLDGANQSVDMRSTDSLNVGVGDFTVVAWIYPTAFGGAHDAASGVVSKGGYSWAQGWLFDFNAVGQGALRLETSVGTSGGQGAVQTDPGAVILNNWQQVAVSCQRDPGATGGQNTTGNGFTKIYVNGVVVKTGDIGAGDLTTALPLTIGRIANSTSALLTGGVDDVALFGQALSGEQIAELYRKAVGELPPAITTQPADQVARPGGSAAFAVKASGTPPFAYQWYFEGSSIDGATSDSYSINPVAAFDAGGYSVVITNSFGSVTSRVASLTILPFGGDTLGVNFSTDCADPAADRIGLSEVADGFQGWENIPIRTCAGQNIVPGNATVDDGVVTVSWAASAVWYDGSTATPDEKLFRIYLDDGDAGNVTVSGLSAWLAQVTATNSALDAFKVRLYWSANTGSSLAPLDIHDGSDAGPVLETVQPLLPGYGTGVQRAMGDSAPLNSDTIAITWPARPADLSVRASLAAFKITASASLERPAITSEPADQLVRPGGIATFSVSASGSLPLSYQWYHAGTSIGGASSPGYSINPVADLDAGGYWVVVANSAGSVTSRVATLTTEGLIDWTPAQLGSGTVKNWYDADATSTLWQDAGGTTPVTDNGQAVLRWTDKSGNGNDLTSVNGPAYMPGVMNSRPVLQFADSSLARTAGLTMGNITDNFTVVGVFKVAANNGWDNWIRWGNGGQGDPDVFVVSGGRAGGPAEGMEFGYDGGEGETTDVAVTGQPAFMFIGALDQVPNPDLFSIWKDGVSQGSRNPTAAYRTTPSASLSEFRIGISDSNSRNPNGDIAELLILNTGAGNLAPADREKLEGYLANKWWGAGDANPLPAGHPYKTTVPVTQLLQVDITRSAQGITITWSSGTLQSATTLAPAHWVDMPTATSPYPVNPTNAANYYRVRQ